MLPLEGFLNSTFLSSSIALGMLFSVGFIFGSKKTKPASHKGEDQEKIAMSRRIYDLENANKDLRERLRKLEMEYLERQENIKNSELELEKKNRDMDEGLKEVYALKETIEEHRLKIVNLTKEKEKLTTEVGELTAKVKDGKKRFDEEFSLERKRLEDEKEDIKKKAKEMVVTYKKEVEEKIKAIEEENKSLKEKIQKMKEQYSAWEAIEGL